MAEDAPEAAAAADAGAEAAVAQQEERIRRGAALLRGLFAPRYKPAATFDEMDEARLCHPLPCSALGLQRGLRFCFTAHAAAWWRAEHGRTSASSLQMRAHLADVHC